MLGGGVPSGARRGGGLGARPSHGAGSRGRSHRIGPAPLGSANGRPGRDPANGGVHRPRARGGGMGMREFAEVEIERYSDPQGFAREVNLPLLGVSTATPVPAGASVSALLSA